MPYIAFVPCMSALVMGRAGVEMPSRSIEAKAISLLKDGIERSRCSRSGTALSLPSYCASGANVARDCLVLPVKSALPISQCVTPRPSAAPVASR
eukprot:6210179-Pleurochrysis_carterae.AAC.1